MQENGVEQCVWEQTVGQMKGRLSRGLLVPPPLHPAAVLVFKWWSRMSPTDPSVKVSSYSAHWNLLSHNEQLKGLFAASHQTAACHHPCDVNWLTHQRRACQISSVLEDDCSQPSLSHSRASTSQNLTIGFRQRFLLTYRRNPVLSRTLTKVSPVDLLVKLKSKFP